MPVWMRFACQARNRIMSMAIDAIIDLSIALSSAPFVKSPLLVLAALAQQAPDAFASPADRACRWRAGPRALVAFDLRQGRSLPATPSSTLRLLTFTTYCPRGTPSASSVSAASMHNSASAATDEAPTVSASNWVNWRKRPGPGFSLRQTGPHLIAAERLGQGLVILGDVAGERRGQIVAQRQPLLVVVLEREHALVGPVLVGQELAERVGIFDGRGVERLEAVGTRKRAEWWRAFARWREFRPRKCRKAPSAGGPRGMRARSSWSWNWRLKETAPAARF